MLSVKKELKIFRGSYEEVMAQETEDMTIYLSWDTQEIFVGNKFGVKTPYTGGGRLTEREVRDLVESLVESEVDTLQAQMVVVTNTSSTAKSTADAVNARLDDLEEQLSDDITEKVNELITVGSLAEEFYTKEQVDAILSNALINYYNQAQVNSLFPQTDGSFSTDYSALKSQVSGINSSLANYSSVRILSGSTINEGQLLTYIADSLVLPGLYSFKTSSGSEILNKISNSTAVRLSPDGFTRKLVSGSWTIVTDPEGLQIVYSVNDVLPDSEGDVLIDADDISDTAARKWNNVLPEPGTNAVNPSGRNTGYSVGSNSVAFGYNSAAQGSSSIALGPSAINTGNNSIQLGDSSTSSINAEADSLKVWNHKLLDRTTGKIPVARITETFHTATISIAISDWNTGTRETGTDVAVSGITSSSLIWVSPAEPSIDDYAAYGVRAVAQGSNYITFKCDQVPDAEISVNLIWRD
jgi:hypothetical protein